MAQPLNLLIVDDSEDDALLLVLELKRCGFAPAFERVDSRAGLERALLHPPELVLCDYSMPGFSALEALAMVRQRHLDVPFVIVSGTVGESRAVEVMRAGAHDYVFKDNLTRLGVVIERELREAAGRAQKRALQEQLLLCERMASIGIVAAGVVHEINNPLMVLLNAAEQADRALQAELDDSSALECVAKSRTELSKVLLASERIAQIVADVKLFSRPQEGVAASADLQELVESSLRLAMHEVDARCRVTTCLEATPLVALAPSRLGQICLNLILNAAQAFPVGDPDGHAIHLESRVLPSGLIELEVADNGCGIPPELRSSIFRPFVTTKGAGGGTGLGLFITHRIVMEAGGSIEFDSRVGEGTTFRLRLPAFKPTSEMRSERAQDAVAPSAPKQYLVPRMVSFGDSHPQLLH